MKTLLIVTAVLEAVTGLALAVFPSVPVSLLLRSSFDTSTEVAVGRITGAALLALGIACWFARNDALSRAGKGLVMAMLIYNIAAVIVLVYAGIGLALSGIALWPAVLLHAILAVWCISCLRTHP